MTSFFKEVSKVITAKVLVTSKTAQGEQVLLAFAADYADGRNKEWAKFTPGLTLTMGVKPEVAEDFEVGGRYTLYFEKQAETGTEAPAREKMAD